MTRLALAALLAAPVAAQAPAASDSTAFALALHRRAVGVAAKGDNIMLSPYSARQALGMAYLGAGGETRAEMARVLGAGPRFADEERVLREALAADRESTLQIANALFLKKDYPVLDAFVARARQSFAAEVFMRDFDDAALREINDWVSRRTSGKIPSILGALSERDRAVLLNAVYFKGKWRTAFPKEKPGARRRGPDGGPRPEFFTPTVGKPFALDLMSVRERFDYADTPGWQAVRLPYRGGRLAMLALLPSDASSMAALRGGLDAAFWSRMRGLLQRRRGLVAIPRFKFARDYDLIPPLTAAGMSLPFDRQRSDFSGISAPKRREDELYISKVVQKTFVAVDEEGTEAAAATAAVAAIRGSAANRNEPPPFEFIADRPFLFAIEDSSTGTILFLGEVHDPRK